MVVFWTTPNPITGVSGLLQWGFLGTLSTGGGTIPFDLGSYERVLEPDLPVRYGGFDHQHDCRQRHGGCALGPRTWYLDNVTFDDGGQATGSFVYDSVTNTYSNMNIDVTPGSTFTSDYHYGVPGVNRHRLGSRTPCAYASLPANTGDRLFNGTFLSRLPTTAGPFLLTRWHRRLLRFGGLHRQWRHQEALHYSKGRHYHTSGLHQSSFADCGRGRLADHTDDHQPQQAIRRPTR